MKKIQIFKKNSHKNLFFILLLYYTLTEKLHGNAAIKKEVAIFLQLEIFVDKTISISTYSTKLMILLLLNTVLQYSLHFI